MIETSNHFKYQIWHVVIVIKMGMDITVDTARTTTRAAASGFTSTFLMGKSVFGVAVPRLVTVANTALHAGTRKAKAMLS